MRAMGVLACVVLASAGACGRETRIDGLFTEAEWEQVQTLSPLPEVPSDPTNAFENDADAARLGQMLFFETAFAGPISAEAADDGSNGGLGAEGETARVACASCHMPETWFMDRRSMPNDRSFGTGRTGSNAPSVVNAAYYTWFFSSGTRDSMWAHATTPPEIGSFMASDRLQVAHFLFARYRTEYDALFDPPLDPALDPAHADAARFPPSGRPKSAPTDPDGPWEAMTAADQEIVNRIFVNFGKALHAYQRLLVSGDAPFDRYVAGERSAMEQAAKRGLRLFIGKAACIACHSGPLFADGRFHNIGIPETRDPPPEGRFSGITSVLAHPFNSSSLFSDDRSTGRLDGLAATEADRGSTRTRTLRQIAETGPYMHTGAFPTLTDVVDHYDRGGAASGYAGVRDPLLVPLNLSSDERADLVAFLETLTGQPVYSSLRQDIRP